MFNTLPDSQIRNLVGHLSQCLCGPQYVFPLFSSTQLSHLAGFVQNHTQGNFTRVPWGAETHAKITLWKKKKRLNLMCSAECGRKSSYPVVHGGLLTNFCLGPSLTQSKPEISSKPPYPEAKREDGIVYNCPFFFLSNLIVAVVRTYW